MQENVKITEKLLPITFIKLGYQSLLRKVQLIEHNLFNLGFANLIERKLVDKSSIVALFDANRPL